MNDFVVNSVGYIALVINLFSMFVKGEYRLRSISAVANALYIGYGFMIGAYPLIIGCAIAVCLHLYHMKNLKTQQK